MPMSPRPMCLALLACWSLTALVAVEPLVDCSSAGFTTGTVGPAGVAFRFDLGTRRVNWNKAAWAQRPLPATRDLSAYRGVRISVTTTEPRADAAVALALREADGSWHYCADAADLVNAETQRLVPWSAFHPAYWIAPHSQGLPADHYDQNQHFDPEAVDTVAVGVANARGVGIVTFTLTALELVPAPGALAPDPAVITVTGATWDVNGTTHIPAGLFGHFPGGASADMRVGSHREIHHSYLSGRGEALQAKKYCTEPSYAVLLDVQGGDRYSSSGRLTDSDWQRRYRRAGRGKGRQMHDYRARYDREIILEWWNEPYLNWSNRSRKNFKTDFFDCSRAVEGGPVHLRVDGTVAPFLRWTRDYDAPPWNWKPRDEWRGGRDERGRLVRRAHPPSDVADGETFVHPVMEKRKNPDTGAKETVKVGEQTFTATTPWYVYDVTQFTYWSGQSQLKFYNEPMLAFARGLRAVDRQTKFIAGWDFRPSEDDWAGFRLLYKPTIDAGIEYLHGVTDHDYGGDVTRMPANYEVITAYGMAYHDTWLYAYNTECGENSDPSANPAASQSMRQAGKKWLKCMWSSRKIVHALATVPDKARSATFHWFDKGAEGVTFTILKNLRGRLVRTRCDDPRLYVVAAIDGTDPELPREPYLAPGHELVVAVFNDHRQPRAVEVPLSAPTGTTFAELIVRRTVPDADGGRVRIVEERLPAAGASARWTGAVRAKGVTVLTLPLTGTPVDAAETHRHQIFADDILQRVQPGAPVELRLRCAPERRAAATRAVLRGVFERLAPGEGTVQIGTRVRDERGRWTTVMDESRRLELPSCATPVNVCWIRDVPLDPDWLHEETVLRFTAADGHAGYLVGMASVLLDD